MSNVNLFDYLNDITHNKEYLFDPLDSSEYKPFVINKGLGQHLDTVLLANEMNKRNNFISKEMHHDFLFYSVDAKKRFGKWAKQDTTDMELVGYIQNKYSVNKDHALTYLSMMDKDEVKFLLKESERKGGVRK